MTDARLLLSVVIPSRNRPQLLRRVLDALERQEDMPPGSYEVIVVLDGDTERTSAMLSADDRGYPLNVIELPHRGVAAARNTGWRAARAEHILFIDDDMVATPRLLVEHVSARDEHPGQVILGRFSADLAAPRTAWSRYDELVQERRYDRYARGEQLSGIRCYSGNLAVPRPLLERVGGFDQGLVRNEDVDLGFRLQALGARIVFAPRADALHCGYRDLDGWLRIPLTYGRVDVAMYRDRGYGGGLESIVATYHDRHPLNRFLIWFGLVNRWTNSAVVYWATRAGIVFHALKLDALSYGAMSAACNVLYWAGVRDGLRGNASFWRMVKATRHHTGRPYDKQLLGRAPAASSQGGGEGS